jgi:hypothetical protein
MSVQSDFFFVQLPNGQHKAMSLDELDAAYQAGAIDERTPVRPDGAGAWSTLGALLSASDDDVPDTSPSVTPPPYETAATPYTPNSLAPVAVWSPAALAPTVNADLSPDLDLDDLAAESALRPSKTKYVLGALGAVAAIAAVVGFGVARAAATDAASDLASAPKAAAAAPPPPEETKLPDPKPESRLTEEQKRLLAEQDKKHEADAAKKRAERAERASHAGSRHHHRRGKSKDPFVKTGSKFDPLNGSL